MDLLNLINIAEQRLSSVAKGEITLSIRKIFHKLNSKVIANRIEVLVANIAVQRKEDKNSKGGLYIV